MKKTLLILVAVLFAVSACDKATYVDGTYKVDFSEADSHGWTAFLEFTLTEDMISNVDYDYLNADNVRKSEDSAYNASMGALRDTYPELFMPLIEAAIEAATILPQFDSIDGVTGATGSSADANILVEAALDLALTGESMTTSIPQPE